MRLNRTLVRFPPWCISFGWVRTQQLNSGVDHYNQLTPVWRSGLSPVTNKLWYGSCPWSDLDHLNFYGHIQLPYPAALCDMDWERLCKQTASSLPEHNHEPRVDLEQQWNTVQCLFDFWADDHIADKEKAFKPWSVQNVQQMAKGEGNYLAWFLTNKQSDSSLIAFVGLFLVCLKFCQRKTNRTKGKMNTSSNSSSDLDQKNLTASINTLSDNYGFSFRCLLLEQKVKLKLS